MVALKENLIAAAHAHEAVSEFVEARLFAVSGAEEREGDERDGGELREAAECRG
jgi:hypothetical protein